MRTRLLPCVLAASILSCGTAAGQEPWSWGAEDLETIRGLEKKVKARRETRRLRTRHWILDTKADARFTAELGLFMERYLEVFSKLLSGRSIVAVKPTVVVMGSAEEYREDPRNVLRGRFGYRYDESGNFTEFHLYTYMDEAGQSFSEFPHAILLHEGTHALLQSYLATVRIPPWFNEGLATHFESWDLRLGEEENRQACRAATAWKLWRVAIRQADGLEAIPLQEVLSLGYEQPWIPDQGGPRTGRNYAVTAALADFLLSSTENKKMLVEVFGRLSRGVDPRRVLKPEEIRELTPKWEAHWRLLLETAQESDRPPAVRRRVIPPGAPPSTRTGPWSVPWRR